MGRLEPDGQLHDHRPDRGHHQALNGALLARRPDHYRNFTVVGILLMALLGGIGGGVTRDVMVAEVPAALKNPAYITLCLAAGVVGYRIAFAKGQLFRSRGG